MKADDSEQKISGLVADENKRFVAKYGASRQRHILLVGGGGYIGSPVAAELLRRGFKVRNLEMFVYGTQPSVSGQMVHPDYELMIGDLCDPKSVDRALDGITDVVLLAGLVGDPITKSHPNESHAINDVGLQTFFDSLNGRKLNKVIFISTCSNYGLSEGDKLSDENSPLQPLSLYAKAKVAMEQRILGARGALDFSPVVLRFATAFGVAPRMRFDLTVNEFIRELYLGKELVVYDANTWRPYCHVRDFARLIHRVLEFPVDQVAFEVFNAGGDENNHTKQSIVDQVVKHLPNSKVSYKEFGTDPRNYRVDFRKVRERMLFVPHFDVPYGVVELLGALRAGFFSDHDLRRNFYGNYQVDYHPEAPKIA
jgi:nucleoside-diphosphate-sugar epimerase